MKGLFSHIKNNHIIYKVSVISIILLMLISVVQINPNNENKIKKEKYNKVSNDGTVYDYYLQYDSTSGSMSKVDKSGNVTTITADNKDIIVDGWSVEVVDGKNVLVLDNFNFITSCNIVFEFIEDTIVEVKNNCNMGLNYDGTDNFSYGIKALKSVIIQGNGKLNLQSIDNKNKTRTFGIWSDSAEIIVKNIDLDIIIDSKDEAIGIDTFNDSGTDINISNASVNMDITSTKNSYGILSLNNVTIENSIVNLKIIATSGGVGIRNSTEGKINIDKSQLNVLIKTASEMYGLLSLGGNSVDIASSIIGIYLDANSSSYGICSQSGDINIDKNISSGEAIVDSNIEIDAGNKAICSIMGGNIVVPVPLEARITRGGESIIPEDATKVSSYQYIKIGKPGNKLEENYKIVYDVGTNRFYKDSTKNIKNIISATELIDLGISAFRTYTDGVHNTILNLNGVDFTTSKSVALEILGDENADKNIIIKTRGSNILKALCNTITEDVYGIKISGLSKNVIFDGKGSIEVITENTAISVKNESAIYAPKGVTVNSGIVKARAKGSNGVGITAGVNLSVQDGRVVVQGKESALALDNISNISLAEALHVMASSKDFNGETLENYVETSLLEYKYLDIGKLYDYGLKFYANASNISDAMKKVDASGNEINLTTDDLKGWEVVEESGKKVLVLKGLNFSTSYPKALQIDGEATIRIQEGTSSCIGVYGNSVVQYGIYTVDNLSIVGKGELNINNYNGEEYGRSYTIVVNSTSIKNFAITDTQINIIGNSYNQYGLSINGNMVLNNIKMSMNIYGTEFLGIGCFRRGTIELNESIIYMDMISIGEESSSYGVSTTNNINIDEKSILDINIQGKNNCYGIFGNESGISLYNYGNINLNISCNGVACGISYYNTIMDGGNSRFNIFGKNNSYGIVCMKNYTQNAGKVSINTDDSNGIGIMIYNDGYFNATASITDGTLEITANKVIDKAPTLTEGNVSISSAKQNGSIVTSPSVNDITGYNYVRIEPTYYITYNATDKKIYKNDTTTEITVAGLTADEVTGHLVMDGLSFTTSNQYGLQCVGDTTIELATGSENNITINYTGTDDSYVIYSTNDVTINGKGVLKVNSNSENSATRTIVVNNFILNNANMNINCNGKNSYGIQATNNVCITSSKLIIDSIAKTGDVAGIVSDSANVTIEEKSYCKVNVEVIEDGTSCYGIKADDVATIKDSNYVVDIVSNRSVPTYFPSGTAYYYSANNYVGVYSKGTDISADNIALKLENSNIKINSSVNGGYGLYTYDGDILISEGDIDIESLSDKVEDILRTDFVGI